MSTDRETTRIVRSWLEEGATALPDRVLDAVLDQVPTTRQRRPWWPAWMLRLMTTPDLTTSKVDATNRTRKRNAQRVPRRNPSMNRLLKWAVAAAVVAVVGGLAFVVLQQKAAPTNNVASSPGPPSATPTATSSAAGLVATGNATAVAAGGRHTCALTQAGGVKCWGDNFYGELGNGSTKNSSTPVDVLGLTSGVSAIAVGWSQSCALTAEGGVKCWGQNESGQLGDGTETNSAKPVNVSGLSSGVIAIEVGGFHACALLTGRAVKCWGWNGEGQLGNGSSKSTSTPVDVSGLPSSVRAIAAGFAHTCALMNAGAVKCWGWNVSGQLGNGSTIGSATPVDLAGLTIGVTAIAAGNTHTCALTNAGGVKCWGFSGGGQLGNGSTIDSATPVDVAGLASGVTAISAGVNDIGAAHAGGSHTCALASGGRVKCWGENGKGQLGDGTLANNSTPVDVSGLASGVIAITPGGAHTCAVMSGGGVACWGRGDIGQLGDGTATDSSTPVVVKGL